ncbi:MULTISPECIES: gamma carbonic anhydrase family protein [unclassified Paenibacillus]|uniref:gamma carbonic anhydrase family protein n=1 Tax=unclassified Paenibacillus TaxID=185978 RepID=UPI001AEA6938|nr:MULTISPECIES: gamma carbonic anhydrase family protein [unclassified Paenibacillus]MBP1156955.1 carbonic anhydrase/acetyltransferase-like protein (isoleucine patch superfamily) [Paenibacillus sp. PvP091]MBP1172306.1 carbonic anhydrase/acetyltransferase-like protein (isoleucine patch superfamily) [Paenibacillus sp. PvR098]MBP2438687.1 carbonic anhydrase/acetyltransferase-like protein (isoleucine patch superfamily) [Paenibacillus sp. PvP052]
MIFSLGEYKPQLNPTAYIAPGAHLIGNITMGAESSVWFNAVLRGDNAPIIIGERTNIQDGSTLHVDPGVPLHIGEQVSIGHNVILHGCTIHDGALIGMGSIVMNHAEIGEQALIAAGTLIPENKKIPPRVLVMGSPGKVVRELNEQDLQMLQFVSEHYVGQSRRYLEAKILAYE